MALREPEFFEKFWTLSGGVTLITELVLALMHRRIISINKVKQGKQEIITREQLIHCNGLVKILTRLGYSFRSFIDTGPSEPQLLQRLKEVIVEYKKSIRVCHRRLRILFNDEPAEDETSKTLLMKLTSDPETIPYYKAIAIDLIRLYICYMEVIQVIIGTNTHYGQPIGLNSHGIEKMIGQLRTISSTLERMTIMPRDLRSNESRNCDPLYILLRKFHYLIKTFHVNQEILLRLQPEPNQQQFQLQPSESQQHPHQQIQIVQVQIHTEPVSESESELEAEPELEPETEHEPEPEFELEQQPQPSYKPQEPKL